MGTMKDALKKRHRNQYLNMPAVPGNVETKYLTFDGRSTLNLESGTLGPVTLAYETYGRLNSDKSNAILVLHAFPATPTPPDSTPGRRTPAGGTT